MLRTINIHEKHERHEKVGGALAATQATQVLSSRLKPLLHNPYWEIVCC